MTQPAVQTLTRITYYMPGTFLSEETCRWVPAGQDPVPWAVANQPAGAFAFIIEDVLDAGPIPDGRGGVLQVMPKAVTKTGRYYLAGRLFDRDEVLALGGHDILAANMQNQWPLVILTPQGNWQPFEDRDVLLTAVSR